MDTDRILSKIHEALVCVVLLLIFFFISTTVTLAVRFNALDEACGIEQVQP